MEGAVWASFARLTTGQQVAVLATVITLIGRQLLILNVETVVLVATGSFGTFLYTRFGQDIGVALNPQAVIGQLEGNLTGCKTLAESNLPAALELADAAPIVSGLLLMLSLRWLPATSRLRALTKAWAAATTMSVSAAWPE